jgi:hypothetical protein
VTPDTVGAEEEGHRTSVAAFHPAFEDLPPEIAVFPLAGALLLPQARLPLNIFEPRYLAMTLDSLAAGRMFGMIQPQPGAPAGETGPGLFRTGCLGRLSSFSETEDGRLLITLTGVVRFLVAEELPMRRGYRRVRADYTPFRATSTCRSGLPRSTARRCSARSGPSSRCAASRRTGTRWSRLRTPCWC